MAFFERFKGKKKEKNNEVLPAAEEIIIPEEEPEVKLEAEEPEQKLSLQETESVEEDVSTDKEKTHSGFFDRFKKKSNGADLSDNTEEIVAKGGNEEEDAADSRDVSVEADSQAENKVKKGFFEKLKKGLSKTRENINEKIEALVKSSRKLDDEFWEELEEILIQADVGVNTSLELVENIKKAAKKQKVNDSSDVMRLIREEVSKLLDHSDVPLNISNEKPTVILVVGVNGAGKTTSIAKLANRFRQENHKVILAAADTFRAAAIDQLQIWADRVGVELIKHQEGSDPGAVVYDAISAARARKADFLIIDTAGRLQNKSNLMKEIGKVRSIIQREIPAAPHEVLLVLDATTGQNAISQAKIFEEATGVSGLILTKLDGTAKGGIVLAVVKELNIPVKLVGIGEGLEDLRDFSPQIFAEALFDNQG